MKPLALYIHWPFCVSKCPYCDFNSHVRAKVDHKIWKESLLQELRATAQHIEIRPLTSIFFGGGTPSLMESPTVQALIEEAKILFGFKENIEITLEANPNSFEKERFQDFKNAGINRISLGIQSFLPEALKFLGRAHSAEEARDSLTEATALFERVSFDLIYARPHQTQKDWEKELLQALEFAPSHLSLYQLTFEEGTSFEKRLKRGEILELSEDASLGLYAQTQDIMMAHNLPSYEVSNYAKIGQESRHNLAYWQYQEYMGIGPGAHGRIDIQKQRYATQNLKSPEKWLESIQKHGHGLEGKTLLTQGGMLEEALLMGLRLRQGVCLKTLEEISQEGLEIFLKSPSLETLKNADFLELSATHLIATSKGFPLLNGILGYLL